MTLFRSVFIFILVSLVLPAAYLAAQNPYAVSNIPRQLIPRAESVVRQDITTIRINSSGDIKLLRSQAITYLVKTDRKDLNLVLFEDRFTNVRSMSASIYDASGQLIQKYGRSDIQAIGSFSDYEFTDRRTKILPVPSIEPPFTVEYAYEIGYQDFFFIPNWTVQLLGQSTEHAELNIFCPEDYKFYWKGVRTDIQPVHDALHGSWRWTSDQVKALRPEPGHPYFYDQYAYLIFAPESFTLGTHQGSMGDWKRFGQFVFNLNDFPAEVSPELSKQVRDLIKYCRSEQEKIAVLYKFLQENTRYVSVQIGVGGWQAFDAAYVDKKRYGDCKALSNYMRALLKVAGIPSWLALVYGDEDGAPELFSEIAYPAFNHMILYVPSSNTWLECTSHDLPPGYLGSFTSNRKALLLTPEGGKLVDTPPLTEKENQRNLNTQIQLSDDAVPLVRCHGVLNGTTQEAYRNLVLMKSDEEVSRYFSEHAGFQIVSIDQLSIRPVPDRPSMSIDYQLLAPGLATKTGKRIFINCAKFTPIGRSLPIDTARTLQFVFTQGLTINDTLNISLPPNYVVEKALADAQITSEFGTYRRTSFTNGDKIVVIRNAVFLPVNVNPEHYAQVQKFYAEVVQADTRQMVLVKKE